MLRHLLKLVWNRKRANFLIVLEIFFSFLVVFVVGTLGLFFWDNLQAPLGFDHRDVVVAKIDTQSFDDRADPERLATVKRLLDETRALPAVVSAAAAMIAPYEMGGWTSNLSFGGRRLEIGMDAVGVDYERTLGLRLVEGHFFEAADEALDWQPVVINAALSRAVFGGASPLGRRFGDPSADSPGSEQRVVGVIEEFRKDGELSRPGYFAFVQVRDADRTPRRLLIKLRPGTPVEIEEELARRLQAVAPGWSLALEPLSRLREENYRTRLIPLVVGGIVAFFLLAMVGLGLVGVLWQNLLRRAREVGLRRAVGASRSAIHRQVVLEQLILASFGIVLGVALVVQLPLLELAGFLSPRVFAAGLLLASLAIYLLAALCAFYPSRIIGLVDPAEALRYE